MRHALWEASVSPRMPSHTHAHTNTIMLRYVCMGESKTKQVNDRVVQHVKDLGDFHVTKWDTLV